MRNTITDIMNIPVGKDCPEELPSRMVYKMGHRDARHAAVDLVLGQEQTIKNLIETLDDLLEEAQVFAKVVPAYANSESMKRAQILLNDLKETE